MGKQPEKLNPDAVIQFRPGESFGRGIADLAARWAVSRNEVGRRLGLLSWSELTLENYEALERLADHFGGPNNFLRACDYVRGVLSSLDRQRQEQKAEPLYRKARNEFVDRCVQDLLLGRKAKQKTPSNSTSTEKETSGESNQSDGKRRIRVDETLKETRTQKKE